MLFSFFMAISFVFSADVLVDKQMKKYDANSNAETGIFSDYESNSDGEVEVVPPPPGNDLLRTRKTRGRTESFHISANDMKMLNPKEVFANPKCVELLNRPDKRMDSNVTDVEEWEGFYMDLNSICPSRSCSRSSSIKINSVEKPQKSLSNSSSDSYIRKKIFSSSSSSPLSKSRSLRSTWTLTSFSEVEESSEDSEVEDK